uniref:Uncharacterized protein n=1 Tax=Oryza brachyantha TaxID=4533 RepID=J3MSE1_ORYBR
MRHLMSTGEVKAERGDGVDEAVVEVGRPAEAGLGVGRQHQARDGTNSGKAASSIGIRAAVVVVDEAGEHLLGSSPAACCRRDEQAVDRFGFGGLGMEIEMEDEEESRKEYSVAGAHGRARRDRASSLPSMRRYMACHTFRFALGSWDHQTDRHLHQVNLGRDCLDKQRKRK